MMSDGELTQLLARYARARGEGDIRVVKRFEPSEEDELQKQLAQRILDMIKLSSLETKNITGHIKDALVDDLIKHIKQLCQEEVSKQ
jgi:hypothetical protein